MDLLRAAVAGAAGTPYHDQLFFFDIQLPPEYPNAPPLVQYHSWGMRANPNLVRLQSLISTQMRQNKLWGPHANQTLLDAVPGRAPTSCALFSRAP